MSKLKCPRCKAEIGADDIFCMSCGSPVKEETKKEKSGESSNSNAKIEPKIIEEKKAIKEPVNPVIEPSTSNNESNNGKSKKGIIIIAVLLVLLLISLLALGYFLFFKEEKKCEVCKCPDPEVKIVEKEPTIQYINFDGYRFSMPLDWNFEGDSGEYRFTNEEETLYVLLSNLDTVTYDEFTSDEYMKKYIEILQSSYDIFIDSNKEVKKSGISYYVLEGEYESYNYIIVVTENKNGIFITESQFESNSVYNNKKQEVIDFAISVIKNDKI